MSFRQIRVCDLLISADAVGRIRLTLSALGVSIDHDEDWMAGGMQMNPR